MKNAPAPPALHRPPCTRAVAQALPLWSLPPATRIEPIGVSENAVFRLVDADSDRRLVLRVHRPGYHSLAEIASELAWINALRANLAFPTPPPVPGADGELLQRLPARGPAGPLHAVAFAHAPGSEPPADAAGFRRLGALAARLHTHARAWTRPPGFVRKCWNFRSMLGEHPLWGDWRAAAGLDAAATVLLARAAETLRLRLARFGTAPDRFGLIHADLRPANLLAADGGALAVIDFDDCGFGWFAYDFASAVSFFEHDPQVPSLLAAWLEGYRGVAPLPPGHAAEIPAFILLRRLVLLAWTASRAETPTARALGPAWTAATLPLAEEFLRRYAVGRAYRAKEPAKIR